MLPSLVTGGKDVLGLGAGSEKLGQRRAGHGVAGLQAGDDPMPPKGKLGVLGRGRVRVDEHREVRGVGGSAGLSNKSPMLDMINKVKVGA